MLKKAVMLVSGSAFGSALLLVRNLIVARLVSPEDYGIASTFAVAMSIVEMLSYFGLNQLIVVDKDGDDPYMQRAMQGFQVLRGFTSSLALFLIAYPYARFLGVEHIAWTYQVIALIPLINGFKHFDMDRLKRHMRFGPSVITSALAPLAAVLALWPIALFYGDYRIMLASLFVQAGATVLLSHLTAERRYGIAFDFALMRRATIFGWPLLLNGMLLFGVFNGERLIVGNRLGMTELAVFSMAITLTLTPTLVLINACQSLFLPQLSAARDKVEAFRWLGITTVEAGMAIGLALLVGAVLIAGPLAHLLLGAKYSAILGLLVPMAVLQAVRVAKTGASTVALARERTGNAMASNLFRVLSLPVSWYVLTQTGDVLDVILIGTVAEVLGFILSLRLASKRAGLMLRPLIVPTVLSAIACAAALIDAAAYPAQTSWASVFQISHFGVALACLVALASMTGLRGYLLRHLRRR